MDRLMDRPRPPLRRLLPLIAAAGLAIPALTRSAAPPSHPAIPPADVPASAPTPLPPAGERPGADGPAAGQDRGTETRPAGEDKAARHVVEIVWADASTYTPDGVATLIGHVHLREGSTHFHADRVIYNENTKKGEAIRDPGVKGGSIGDPVVQDDRNTLTADRFLLDFSPKDPRLKVVSAAGHVRFVAKPKPDAASRAATSGPASHGPAASGAAHESDGSGKDDRSGKDAEKRARLEKQVKEETVLTCDRLDYFYRSRRAVAEGNMKVVQGKRWLTGDQAIYYDRYDTVVVNGNVKGEDEKGRTFAADNLKVVLNGESETIEASKFHGTFALDKETDSDASEPAPPPLPGSDETPKPAPAPSSPP